jgi:hypothetical protein
MENFDKNSILANQDNQVEQLEALLKKEKEKREALRIMFEKNEMNEKLLFSSTPTPNKKPFHYLPGLLSAEEANQTREFFKVSSNDEMNQELVGHKNKNIFFLTNRFIIHS